MLGLEILLKTADLRSGMLWLAIVLALVVVAVLIFGRKKQEEVVIIRQISLKDLSEIWEKKRCQDNSYLETLSLVAG